VNELHAFALLACVGCRRSVVVGAHAGDVVQGRVTFEDYRICPSCGREMQDTERGDCGHVLLPGEDCCRS
jgi:hypothetical protein